MAKLLLFRRALSTSWAFATSHQQVKTENRGSCCEFWGSTAKRSLMRSHIPILAGLWLHNVTKKKKRQRSTVVSWEISHQCKGTQSSRGWLVPTSTLQIASCLQCYSRLRKGPRDSSCWAHWMWPVPVWRDIQTLPVYVSDKGNPNKQMLKNWCFWTVALEKTLESPLDSKEIKPVNPKGNQLWIFTGRTDAEAPILWLPNAKSWLIRKDPDSGKGWRQEEKGTTEDEMVGWHHLLNAHESGQTPGDSEGQGSLAPCSPWGGRVRHCLATEQLQLSKILILFFPLLDRISKLFNFSRNSRRSKRQESPQILFWKQSCGSPGLA